MKVDAPRIATADNVTVTLDRDDRFTPIGRFLRLGFDELPQLLNVLAGHMSLIGPRPDEPEDLPLYDDIGRRRLTVRPGITGLAAVCGSRRLTAKDRYWLDAHYVDHLTLALDIWILLYTPLYILGLRGPGIQMLQRILPEGRVD